MWNWLIKILGGYTVQEYDERELCHKMHWDEIHSQIDDMKKLHEEKFKLVDENTKLKSQLQECRDAHTIPYTVYPEKAEIYNAYFQVVVPFEMGNGGMEYATKLCQDKLFAEVKEFIQYEKEYDPNRMAYVLSSRLKCIK